MTEPQSIPPVVINDRLFDPDRCLIYTPNEGATGVSEPACRILTDLVRQAGKPLASGRLAITARTPSPPADDEVALTIAELNRLLGPRYANTPCIEVLDGAGYALDPAALANQPPPDDPRYRPRPFLHRPATWGAVIALVLALAAFSFAVSSVS